MRLVSGEVEGGAGSEPGIVHACQCRIVADAVIERDKPADVRSVNGVLSSLRALSPEVMEVGIRTDRALPYHAGQYTQLRFSGYPSRPFSMTHPLRGNANSRSVWFHIRRMKDGRVTSSLGKRIKPGHQVKLTGPYGAAYFRPNLDSRIILVATNTGFAPIWSIAVAALRENRERAMMIIAGGRTIESLYMGPALVQLASFPNVRVVPVCSAPQTLTAAVMPGRPTDCPAGLAAERCALRLRRAGDGRFSKGDRRARRRGLLRRSVPADRRRHGGEACTGPPDAVARHTGAAADAPACSGSARQPAGTADAGVPDG